MVVGYVTFACVSSSSPSHPTLSFYVLGEISLFIPIVTHKDIKSCNVKLVSKIIIRVTSNKNDILVELSACNSKAGSSL